MTPKQIQVKTMGYRIVSSLNNQPIKQNNSLINCDVLVFGVSTVTPQQRMGGGVCGETYSLW